MCKNQPSSNGHSNRANSISKSKHQGNPMLQASKQHIVISFSRRKAKQYIGVNEVNNREL